MKLYRLKYINPNLSEKIAVSIYSDSTMLLHEYLTAQNEEQKISNLPEIKIWKIDRAFLRKNSIYLDIWEPVERSIELEEINKNKQNTID